MLRLRAFMSATPAMMPAAVFAATISPRRYAISVDVSPDTPDAAIDVCHGCPVTPYIRARR